MIGLKTLVPILQKFMAIYNLWPVWEVLIVIFENYNQILVYCFSFNYFILENYY